MKFEALTTLTLAAALTGCGGESKLPEAPQPVIEQVAPVAEEQPIPEEVTPKKPEETPVLGREVQFSTDRRAASINYVGLVVHIVQCVGTETVIAQTPDHGGAGQPVVVPSDICADGKLTAAELK